MDEQVGLGDAMTVESDAPRSPATRRRTVWLIVALLLVIAGAAAGTWWAHRTDDLAIGSRHRVAVMVQPVQPGDCVNNIGYFRVRGHGWNSDAHAPEAWGVGEISGWLEVTAAPSLNGPTATFTADAGGSVPLYGGFAGENISLLNCSVAPAP